jgi:hypothetical protein
VALLDVQVFGDSNNCSVARLDPDQKVACVVTHVVTQDDFDIGAVTLQLSGVLAKPAVSAPFLAPPAVSTTVYLNQTAALAVSVTPQAAFTATAGTIIGVKIAVQSVGSVTVSDVAVVSSVLSFTGCSTASLSPGKTLSCDATVAFTQDMVDAGLVRLSASATGKGASKDPVVGDTTTQLLIPSVSVLSSRVTAVTAPTKAGESATLTIEWKNTGDTRLMDIAAGTQCTFAALAPGATSTCTWSQQATQGDFDAADASGKPFVVKVVTTAMPNRAGASQVSSTAEAQVALPVNPVLQFMSTQGSSVYSAGEAHMLTDHSLLPCTLKCSQAPLLPGKHKHGTCTAALASVVFGEIAPCSVDLWQTQPDKQFTDVACASLLNAGSFAEWTAFLMNKGNVAVRGVWLSVPQINSSSLVVSCALDGSTTTASFPLLIPAGNTMRCSLRVVVTQDLLELGPLSPAFTVSALNLAAPISGKLSEINIVNAPSMDVQLVSTGCARPTSTGEATSSERCDDCAITYMHHSTPVRNCPHANRLHPCVLMPSSLHKCHALCTTTMPDNCR